MPNWGEVLNKIAALSQFHQNEAAKHQQLADPSMAAAAMRQHYLKELHSQTGRNVIAYYSAFLSKPGFPNLAITDEDKNGFMMAVHKMGKKRLAGLDLILHTPGGDIASTQSIVRYLREMFGDDIRAIVPQLAMSAGTMMACCCREIWMGKHSNLGPIDPQVAGISAGRISDEFKRAHSEIKKDATKIAVWQPIIGKYTPGLLDRCEDAIKWSNTFVTKQLEKVMLVKRDQTGRELPMNAKERADAKATARKIVKALSSHTANKTHSHHIHFQELKDLGMKVFALETEEMDQFQDTVLTIHHCYMHTMMNTPAIKIIENHLGDAMIKVLPPNVPNPNAPPTADVQPDAQSPFAFSQ